MLVSMRFTGTGVIYYLYNYSNQHAKLECQRVMRAT